jgi:2-polyprenyl-6-methoxyphenol hydroxylase-like FAD-dependent oxidoreductase
VNASADVDVDVVVVGAGAAGLYLGARLAAAGLAVRLLEARREPTRHARAIGVHPPGLAALDEIGAAEPLVARASRVRRGHAFDAAPGREPRRLGTLDFAATLPGPWRFVATVPQYDTEAVLEERLAALAPGALRRAMPATGWRDDGRSVTVEATGPAGDAEEIRSHLLVLATGSSGGAAGRLGVPVDGGRYGDTYLMADLPDEASASGPELGEDAGIFLAGGGVVEAFPLPGGRRRWVVKTDALHPDAEAADVARQVFERTGVRPSAEGGGPASAFGVERRLARRLAVGRVWLCGDAAHVVAPIGGQGMTLGWLGARDLADEVVAWRAGRTDLAAAAGRYDARQRRRARRAIARGAWNLRMGRATRWPKPRATLVRALLTPPLAGRMARVFTMQA